MRVDKKFGEALYVQIAHALRDEIYSDRYKYGEFIPTELELCKIFQVSRNTIQKALDILVNKKLLVRIKGRGTFVSGKKIEQKYTGSLMSYHKDMVQHGVVPKTIELHKEIIPANEYLASKLEIDRDDPVLRLERLRFANDIPILHIITHIPFLKAKFLFDIDFNIYSLYEILAQHNISVISAQKMLELNYANSDIAKHLNIPLNTPIFYFETLASDQNNEIIEYSCLNYRADNNRFYF